MAGRIPQDFINDLLDRTDIVQVVGARVELKKAGREYKGLCPFHGEKTPSFHVVPEKGFYHCFGCGQHGTALTFLLEHDHMEFIAAVEELAGLAGMEVPREQRNVHRDRARDGLFDILDRANRFYQQQLRQHPDRQRAVDYLKGRGVSGEIARTFDIGFAPPGYQNLLDALGTDEASRRQLLDAGLVARREETGRLYDRFRDRIMFPIRDGRGRVIAFGGRIMGDGQPKYLNSPETRLFHKGRELYGLFECRRATRHIERVLLVEGYMDVVGLAQAGIPEVVASLGTAATRDHLDKLFRLAPEVVFCFDGDAAGRRAAWKAVDTALEALVDGVEVRLLLLPEGEDPDSLVRAEGTGAFRERIAGATPLSEFLFAELSRDLDVDTMDGRARLVHQAMPLIRRIPGAVFRALLMTRLAELTGLPRDQLEAAVAPEAPAARPEVAPPVPDYGPPPDALDDLPPPDAGYLPPEAEVARSAPRTPARPRPRRGRRSVALRALQILLWKPDLANDVSREQMEQIAHSDMDGAALLAEIVNRLEAEPDLAAAALLGAFTGTPDHDLLRQLMSAENLLGAEALALEFGEAMHQITRLGQLVAQRRALYERVASRTASPEEVARYGELKREIERARLSVERPLDA